MRVTERVGFTQNYSITFSVNFEYLRKIALLLMTSSIKEIISIIFSQLNSMFSLRSLPAKHQTTFYYFLPVFSCQPFTPIIPESLVIMLPFSTIVV